MDRISVCPKKQSARLTGRLNWWVSLPITTPFPPLAPPFSLFWIFSPNASFGLFLRLSLSESHAKTSRKKMPWSMFWVTLWLTTSVLERECLLFLNGVLVGFEFKKKTIWGSHMCWVGKSTYVSGKSFDTFLPLGPCLISAASNLNPDNVELKTVVNGKTMQQGNTQDMLYGCAETIQWLSQGWVISKRRRKKLDPFIPSMLCIDGIPIL